MSTLLRGGCYEGTTLGSCENIGETVIRKDNTEMLQKRLHGLQGVARMFHPRQSHHGRGSVDVHGNLRTFQHVEGEGQANADKDIEESGKESEAE